jgi:hypothetical protein
MLFIINQIKLNENIMKEIREINLPAETGRIPGAPRP